MMKKQHPTLEVVLDEIMLQEPKPSHEALERWSNLYPEYRDQFARFFATWAIQEEEPKKVTVDDARIANHLVSHAMNILYRQNASQANAEPVAGERFCDAVVRKGLKKDDLATQCNLDDSIVAKLDRRLIRVASIPQRCFEQIGNFLNCTVEAVQAMLSGEPIALQSYKAIRARPSVVVEDFIDAVRASDLPPDMQAEWIRIVAAEGTTGSKE